MSNALHQLSADWLHAKSQEEAAKLQRLKVEQQITDLTGVKERGSKTHHADDYKIEVTGTLSIKMDWQAWDQVKGQIAENLRPVKTKTEVDEAGVLYLRDNEPELYALLPLTIAPGKPGVKVTRKEKACE